MGVRIGIVGLCLILLVGGLTGGDLYRNEGLRAQLAAEAMAGGGWLTPTLHGEPHLTKPPGMSVLIGLCSWPVGGVTPWTARLPSVLAGAVAIVVVGWMVGRCTGAQAGWLAAAILPCAPLWLDRVPSAEIDLVQLGWVTVSLGCFLRAVDSSSLVVSRIPPITWWLLTFLGVTAGFFTKWTAPAFFYLTALPFLWWRGHLRHLLSLGHLLGLLLFVVLATGWLLLVAERVGWPALRETLEREALLRLSPAHHPRPYPFGELLTFPLSFLAGCLPWTLVAAFSLRTAFLRELNEPQRALWQLAVCWLVASLAFWTLVPGHRPRHILPAQPAVAILAAMVCAQWLAQSPQRQRGVLSPSLTLRALPATLAAWLVVKLVFVTLVVPQRHVNSSVRDEGEHLARLVPSDAILYLFRLKDDGLLFYYGRPARRLPAPNALTSPNAWCLLTETEWRTWPVANTHLHAQLYDGQGQPIVLVRLCR